MPIDSEGKWLTSAEAAERLQVKPATLYSYVSRGLLHPESARGGRSRFRREEVERLAARGRHGRRAESFELVTESGLTMVEGNRLHYRGADAVGLAGTHRFEQVAEWLWRGSLEVGESWQLPQAAGETALAALSALGGEALPLERMVLATAGIAATDPNRYDTRPEPLLRTARSLIVALVRSLASDPRADDDQRSVAVQLVDTLAGERSSPAVVELIDDALILLADHGLAVPTLVARLSASVGGDVYSAVLAGFCTMRGTKPGAASLAVEGMLERVCMSSAEEVIFEYLRSGEAIPGLGHPLYSEGDPRAAFLLSQLVDAFAGTPSIANVEGMVAAVERRELPPPNADFAVGALTHVAGLPRGYGEAIFSIARTAGWVAHLLEEYTQNRTYRLREIYTGPAPSSQ